MSMTELIIELTLMPLVAFVVGLGMVLMMRKIAARLQRRVGPPLLQPLYDIVKLHSKHTQTSHGLLHEIGHLNGELLIDHLEKSVQKAALRELRLEALGRIFPGIPVRAPMSTLRHSPPVGFRGLQ